MAIIIPDTTLILGELIALIKPTVNIDLITDNGDGTYRIDLCNSYWIKAKFVVSIGGLDYKVVTVVQNESITVKGTLSSTPAPTGNSFVLDAPFFIHGTVKSAKTELDKIANPSKKYPMVFLYEIFRERLVVDPTSSTGFETRVRLFFMNDTDPENFTNSDQYDHVIRPMRTMVQEFMNVLENSGGIVNKLDDDPDLIPYVNFGKYKTDSGMEKKLFNDNISGYELSINLPIKREYLDKLLCEKSCQC